MEKKKPGRLKPAVDDGEESPRRARRRRRLIALLKELRAAAGAEPQDPDDLRGLVNVVARDESERTYLQAIVSGKRGLGDEKASALEKRYDKPPGWFDADASAPWPFSVQLHDEVERLNAEELHRMEVAMWAHLRKDVPPQLLDERSQKEVQKPLTVDNTPTASRSTRRKSS